MKVKTQNLLIISGLLVSTILILAITFVAVINIQEKLNRSYTEFGKILSKTMAIESTDIISSVPEYDKFRALQIKTRAILEGNDDISFVEYLDKDNNTIYSSKTDYPGRLGDKDIFGSSPIIIGENHDKEVVGSLKLGLSSASIELVSKTTKVSLFIIIFVAWGVFVIAILVNSYLITRELNILHDGVKKISTGEFGYKIADIPVNKEIKDLFNAFNDMSGRLHQYEEQNVEQLTLERNKLEAVLMSIVNGVVVCDNYDNVVLINSAAKKILEVEEKQILNTKIQQYCATNGELCFKDKIEQFKDTPLDVMENKPIDFNIEVDDVVIKTLISPMFSKNQDYVGYIVILIDVTKEAEIDKLKSNFISNVSHELRTPVTVLRTYIDTLHNHSEDFDQNTKQEFVTIINKEADRLHKMVNDILDFSRLESPDVKLPKVSSNILETIESSIQSMQVIAQEKNITFTVIKEPDLPEVVMNPESIERVVQNLISNAIKYSPKNGKIKVRAEIASSNKYLEVSVEDQGIGISQDVQKKIFDRFYRVENATHTIKGTGLGLHLVKVAVEHHHQGEVFVVSKVNEGSKFGFRLPLNPKPFIEEDREYPSGVISQQVEV